MCTLVFCVLEDDDAVLKVYVAVANQANRAGAISAIEKKIDDDPVAILGEAAFFQVGFLQKFCQFILKKDAVVNISKGTSDITPNNSRYSRYFLRLRLLKYPSTTKKQKSGNAILPMMSKRLLTKARNPRFEVRYG
mgnify:CR=1 FL=1